MRIRSSTVLTKAGSRGVGGSGKLLIVHPSHLRALLEATLGNPAAAGVDCEEPGMVKSAEGCVCWWTGKKKNWTQGRRAEQQAGTRQHFQSNGCCSTSLSKVQNFSFDQLTHNHSEKGVPGNKVAAFPGIYSTK